MLNFLKASFWSVSSVGIRTIGNLAFAKLIAVYFGPHGIALLNHFQNLLALVTTVSTGGINVGVVRYLASEADTPPDKANYFRAGLILNLLSFTFLVIVLVFFRDYFFIFFADFSSILPFGLWLAFFATGTLLLTLNLFLLSVLLARKALALYALGTLIFSLGSIVAAYFFIIYFDLSLVLLAFLVGHGMGFIFILVLSYRHKYVPALFFENVKGIHLKNLGSFIVMGLGLVITSKLVDFVVRDFIIMRFGGYEAGLWQSIVKISDSYTLVFTSVLGMVYYPQISALLHNSPALRHYIRSSFYVIIVGVGSGLAFFYAFSDWFILLLFEPEFLKGQYLLPYQVLGDFFKMPAWALLYLVLAKAQVKVYLLLQVAFAIFYLALVWVVVEQMGLEGIVVAHAIRSGLILGFCLVFFRKMLF
jgi:polysaccharide transporter, PST family